MQHFFRTLWARLEKMSTLETDSPGERRRKVTLVIIVILSCICGIFSFTNSYVTTGLSIYVVIPLSYATIVGTATLIFLITKRFGLLLYSFLAMILCIPVIFQWSVGGITSPVTSSIIFWSILAPLGSLMFQTVRKAARWFLAFLVLVFISLYFDTHFSTFAAPTPHRELIIGHGINII